MLKYSHESLNYLFISLDEDLSVLSHRFQGWMVWPIIKERLWHTTLSTGFVSKQPIGYFLRSGCRIFLGFFEILSVLLIGPKRKVAIAYSPRKPIVCEGKLLHPLLGLASGVDFNEKFFRILYNKAQNSGLEKIKKGQLHNEYIGALSCFLATFLRYHGEIKKISQNISKDIAPLLLGVTERTIYEICCRQLSLFWVKKILFGWIFRRIRAKTLFIQDPDGKPGEIAAAKALGISIIELQHGALSHIEPDYSWKIQHRKYKTIMTVPDSIFMYGKLWKEMVLSNGFWKDSEITIIGHPAINYFRKKIKTQEKKVFKFPCSLLFPSQYYIQESALKFWESALKMQKENGKHVFNLRIKCHPGEGINFYHQLQEKYKETCQILSPETEVFSQILQSDLLVGYTSMMMLEGLALGKPVISLTSDISPKGFWGTFNISELKDLVPNIHTVDDFFALLKEIKVESNFDAWSLKVGEMGKRIFEEYNEVVEKNINY